MRPDVVINFVLYFVCIHNVTIIKFTYLLTYLLIRCQLAESNLCASEITSRTFAHHEDVDDVTYSANLT